MTIDTVPPSPGPDHALHELVEAAARADYYLCAPADFIAAQRLQVRRLGSVWVSLIPGVDRFFFNRIVGLGVVEAARESELDEAISILSRAGCKEYMASLSPLAQPSQLPEWLAARGFLRQDTWVKVWRGTDPPPAPVSDLRISKIGEGWADAFAEIVLSVFAMPADLHPLMRGPVGKPGWNHYLAFAGTHPVAAAAMFVAEQHAWLGFGATLEEYRCRGGQSALLSRRIEDGLSLGCRLFFTETRESTPAAPNPSHHNLTRSGFSLAYRRPNYVHV